jgi:hypothetical protein
MMLEVLYIMMYAQLRPHFNKVRQYTELINEFLFLVTIYNLCLFTSFTTNPDMHQYFGITFVCIIGLIIILNIAMIVYQAVLDAREVVRQKKIRAMKKHSADTLPKELEALNKRLDELL